MLLSNLCARFSFLIASAIQIQGKLNASPFSRVISAVGLKSGAGGVVPAPGATSSLKGKGGPPTQGRDNDLRRKTRPPRGESPQDIRTPREDRGPSCSDKWATASPATYCAEDLDRDPSSGAARTARTYVPHPAGCSAKDLE